jgi:glycine betaine/proline transport system substrate-binding protein
MRYMTRRRQLGAALLPLVLAGGALSACGSNSSSSGGGGDTSSGGGAVLKSAIFTWTAAQVTNSVLATVAKEHPELGVKDIQGTQLGPAPAWAGAQRGDVDLLSEIALPNQQHFVDSAKSKITVASQTYGDAAQGWFVPTQSTQPGQPLAGLTSVTQLNQYKAPLNGQLVDSDPTFITTTQNKKRLQGYGIDFQDVSSSESAQQAQLQRAIERKQPILVYLYHPSWVFSAFQLTQLQEPNPYTPGCLDPSGKGDCAMPAYSASTALSKDAQKKAPKFYAMLQHFTMPIADVEAMSKSVTVDKQSPDQVAKQYVDSHQQLVQKWLS